MLRVVTASKEALIKSGMRNILRDHQEPELVFHDNSYEQDTIDRRGIDKDLYGSISRIKNTHLSSGLCLALPPCVYAFALLHQAITSEGKRVAATLSGLKYNK